MPRARNSTDDDFNTRFGRADGNFQCWTIYGIVEERKKKEEAEARDRMEAEARGEVYAPVVAGGLGRRLSVFSMFARDTVQTTIESFRPQTSDNIAPPRTGDVEMSHVYNNSKECGIYLFENLY